MKRITKLLALGMAMAMTFGLTVSAAPSNPSRIVPHDEVVNGKGVFVEESDTASDKAEEEAWHGLKVGNLLVNKGLLFNAPNVSVEAITVFRARADVGASGMVTWNPWVQDYDYTILDYAGQLLATYNHSWGYVLVNLDKDWKYSSVMNIKHTDSHGPDTCHQYFEGQLIHDSGDHEWHDYAVMRWDLKLVNDQYKAEISYQVEQPLTLFTDHVAKAFKLLDNDGLGDKIAETYGSLYAFKGDLTANKVKLTGNTYVEFHLPHVDPANQKYVAVLFPYEMVLYSSTKTDWDAAALGSLPGTIQNGNAGRPHAAIYETMSVDFSADMPHFVELTENDVRVESKYGAELPKGVWLVTVMRIGIDGGKVQPTPEVQSAAPTATAGATANAGVQAAGVVSPKTGEMLPVAVILAVICLAGAAVCAKKARNNA